MSDLHTDVCSNASLSEHNLSKFKFRKAERLCSKKQIELLFEGGASKSMTAFPLRAVFRFIARENVETSKDTTLETDEPLAFNTQTQLLISVPKKCFKRAVKRNRVKRQVREAFRRNRSLLNVVLAEHKGEQLLLAMIWLDDSLHSSETVEQRVCHLLKRIGEVQK